jgi:hypothetical protein
MSLIRNTGFEICGFKNGHLAAVFFTSLSLSPPSDQIEDVTGKYGKEEELVTCGICELLDPPVDPAYPVPSTETTEWVGCDCYR